MGLFGEVDAAEVPDNPFYVAPDTYRAILTELNRVSKKDGSGEGLAFKWVIEDEGTDYNGNQIQEWKAIYPDLSSDEVTPEVRKDNARLKGRLLELGLSEDDMNGLLDNLEEYVGTVAYVTVTESADKKNPEKKYTNIQKVQLEDAYLDPDN